MAKKIFEIQINGIDDAVKASQTLIDHLTALEKEGKSLKDLKINITGDAEKKGEKIKETIDAIKKTKVTVNLNGVSQEFNNIKQALKAIKDEMVNLEIAGEDNTDTYRELAKVYQDLALRAQDAQEAVGLLVTHAPELQSMLSVFKGFTAMASVGQGISNLLGIDNDEIQESINKMTSLIGVLEGISKLQEEINSASAFAKMWQSMTQGLDKLNGKILQAGQGLKSFFANLLGIKKAVQGTPQQLQATGAAGAQAAVGLEATGAGAKSAAAGINIMKAASRTFWLFALIEALMKAVEWLGKGVKAFTNWVTGADKAAKASLVLENSISRMNDETSRFYSLVDNARELGLITELEAIDQKSQQTIKNLKELQLSLKLLQDEQKKGSTEKQGEDFWKSLFGGDEPEWMKSVDRFFDDIDKKVSNFFNKPVDTSNFDEIERKFSDLRSKILSGEKKYESQLAKIQRATIDEYIERYNKLDMANEESVKKFKEWADGSNVVQESLRNINNLYEDDKAKRYADAIGEINSQLAQLKIQSDEAARHLKEMNDETEDNNIAAMANGYKKSLAEIQRAREKDLEQHGYTEENKTKLTKEELENRQSIINKYNRQEIELNKDQGEKIENIRRKIRDNILIAEKKGHELRLAQLNNSMYDELRAAQRSGIMVKQQELAIRQKYNKLIIDEEKKHLQSVQALFEEQTNRLTNIEISDLSNAIKNEITMTEQLFDRLLSVDKIKDLDEEIQQFKKDVQGITIPEIFEDKMNGFLEMIDTFNDLDFVIDKFESKVKELIKTLDVEDTNFVENIFNTQPAIESINDVRDMVNRFMDEVSKKANLKEIFENELDGFVKDVNIFTNLENTFKQFKKEIDELNLTAANKNLFKTFFKVQPDVMNSFEQMKKFVNDYVEEVSKSADKINENQFKPFGDNFLETLQANLEAIDDFGTSAKQLLEEGFEFNPQKQLDFIRKLYKQELEQLDKDYKDVTKNMTEEDYEFWKKLIEDRIPLLDNALVRQLEMEQAFAYKEIDIEKAKYDTMHMLQMSSYSKDQEAQLQQEKERYDNIMRSYKEQYDKGEIMKEDYDKLIQKEEEFHQNKVYRIIEETRQKIVILEQQYAQRMKEIYQRNISDEIKMFSDLQSAIQESLNNITIVPNNDLMRFLEIGDIVQFKKAWEDAANNIEVAIQRIDSEMAQLSKDSLNNKDLIQYLQRMKKQLQKQLKGMGVKDMWLAIYNECIDSYKSIADAFVGQLSSLLSTLNETALQLIDNQLEHINHELEIQQEAYDRAEECAEKHKDKMNSIEDELSESRGARREFLIDQLAQQEKAYLQDLEAQQKAAKEKERLEKQQAALEKKRKEQEKKSKIQQAIINTFTAVSNALSVQPWFLGLALSAAALGIGMANVAAIKNTPIYKDGGLLQGKSHKQGGIKVLGGTAEVEGGEFITNKQTTAKNLPLLTYINSRKKELNKEDLMNFFNNNTPKTSVPRNVRKFASGGQLPQMNAEELQKITQVIQVNQDDRPIVVSVVDIADAQDDLRRVQTLAGVV